jgi:hypothetical protein
LTFAAGVVLTALVLLAPALVHATDKKQPSAAPCACEQQPPAFKPWSRPKLAEAKPQLDLTDELATLEAVHLALTEVGDGSSYVWHRRDGWLSGIVKPTASFKDARGRVCRHIELSLAAGEHKGRTEGVACRLEDGRWALEG